MTSAFCDSHAHLTSNTLYPQIDQLLIDATAANVTSIINICTDPLTLERGLELQSKYDWIYNAAATTPHDVEKEGELVFPLIAKHARNGDLIAIGETGLDYHYHPSTSKIQQDFLRRYLHLALECQLPVIIHCREAFEDFFTILDQEYVIDGKYAPGVLHCFTGGIKEAEEVIKRGWFLSLSGIVTFKKSIELQKVAAMVPLHQLLIETDAPYLAPQSKRGKVNQPAYISETAAFIADLRGISTEELASTCSTNAHKLFQLTSIKNDK